MAKIVVKQVRSIIGRPTAQRKVVAALGLGRIGKSREVEDTPAGRGMVAQGSTLGATVDR